MNALDFIFNPEKLSFTTEGLPFTVPVTRSALVTATANAAAKTTSAAVLATDTARTIAEAASTYNTSTPIGFLLYVAAQSQRIIGSGSAGGILFGGPTRSYWMLTLFMVCPILKLLTLQSMLWLIVP
jgi:hypothetical protein